jgi:hypothetical protein
MGPLAAPPVAGPPTGWPMAGPAAGISRFPVTGVPMAGPGGALAKGKGEATATPAIALQAATSRASLNPRLDQNLISEGASGDVGGFF